MVEDLVQGYLRLRRLLTRELGSDDAADLAQESFEVALRYCQAHTVESPGGLLFKIANNLRIDRGRRKWQVMASLSEVEDEEGPSCNVTPEREYEGRQTLTKLCEVLDRLPPRQREAFVLCKLNGMTYDEAAAEMGIRPGVIQQYLVEAMRACRQRLLQSDA
ncbi:RNA polymerase sigma factor [Burkholderia sp. FERM BP-3421]|uniref:RNA polymerase sigma factor n=1 Tax=Burkholderia sp. FERM BP-3421 TaxID=1494466 RepID=UPI0023609480|nr:RNA polymerase sigma factor [Burkholderia sp. FERM BP-3421]WDD92108.1 RNA polymerase sigma factor [Burkholderia sp. FERM BP-3421]